MRVLDLSAHPRLLPDAGSEIHRRVSATDWATTPLGPLNRWSPTLRTAVIICPDSRVPAAARESRSMSTP